MCYKSFSTVTEFRSVSAYISNCATPVPWQVACNRCIFSTKKIKTPLKVIKSLECNYLSTSSAFINVHKPHLRVIVAITITSNVANTYTAIEVMNSLETPYHQLQMFRFSVVIQHHSKNCRNGIYKLRKFHL